MAGYCTCCTADKHNDGSPLCQEVRALPVDAVVEQVLLVGRSPRRLEFRPAAAMLDK